MTVNKLTSPISQNDLINKTNEIIDNLGGGGATDVQINGTSITSNNVANILTESAYSASNKIATMSDLPADEIFIAEYGVTSYADVLAAYNAGKTIVCLYINGITNAYNYNYLITKDSSGTFAFVRPVNNYLVNFELTESGGWSSIRQYELQQTSTAVTHTANTQVGNSTTPVYINSSGVATSTGLSIASSRFDGQWVVYGAAASSIDTTKTSHTTTFNLTTLGILPNDSYNYEVNIRVYLNYKSSSAGYSIYSDYDNYSQQQNYCSASSGSTNNHNTGIIIVGSGHSIKCVLSAAVDGIGLYVSSYRRIGTNS